RPAARLRGGGAAVRGSPGLLTAALPPGEPELPLGGDRLHRRAAPVGGGRRAAEGGAGGAGVAGAGDPPGYFPVNAMAAGHGIGGRDGGFKHVGLKLPKFSGSKGVPTR